MSDLPRPVLTGPWTIKDLTDYDPETGEPRHEPIDGIFGTHPESPHVECEIAWSHDPRDARAIAALPDWIKLADRQAAAIAHARGYLRGAAKAARTIPNPVTRFSVAQAVDQMASDLERILTDGEGDES